MVIWPSSRVKTEGEEWDEVVLAESSVIGERKVSGEADGQLEVL